MNKLQIKRAYEPAASQDGARMLVDRLWPRGVSKVREQLSEWDREIAPDSVLRKAFHDGELSWDQFEQEYIQELNSNPQAAEFRQHVQELLKQENVTLIYSSKDPQHNNAVVLKNWLEKQKT